MESEGTPRKTSKRPCKNMCFGPVVLLVLGQLFCFYKDLPHRIDCQHHLIHNGSRRFKGKPKGHPAARNLKRLGASPLAPCHRQAGSRTAAVTQAVDRRARLWRFWGPAAALVFGGHQKGKSRFCWSQPKEGFPKKMTRTVTGKMSPSAEVLQSA